MQITVTLESNEILKAIPTKDLVNIIEQRQDKNEILEAFSNKELINYVFHNRLIKEDDLALAIESGLINLELLIGKLAVNKLQKNMENLVKNSN